MLKLSSIEDNFDFSSSKSIRIRARCIEGLHVWHASLISSLHVCVCVCVCVSIYRYVYICVCMCVCMFVSVYNYMVMKYCTCMHTCM